MDFRSHLYSKGFAWFTPIAVAFIHPYLTTTPGSVLKTPSWTKDAGEKRNIFSLYRGWLVPKNYVLPCLLIFRGRWHDNLASYMVQTYNKIWRSSCHSLSCVCPGAVSPSWCQICYSREKRQQLSSEWTCRKPLLKSTQIAQSCAANHLSVDSFSFLQF